MEEERMKRLEERRKIIEEEIGQSRYHVIVEDTARCTDVQYADSDEIDYCRRTRIYPECLASLHKKGVIQIPDLLGEERKNYFFVFAKRRILKANEGTQEERKKIEEYCVRIGEILCSKKRKYDKKGNAVFHTEDGDIRIPFTQRELAAMGILPEDVDWEPEEIAKETVAKSTKSVSGSLIKKAGEFLSGLIKAKGEREDD